jgi:diguanylate cyclase (GGDEF)-like protein
MRLEPTTKDNLQRMVFEAWTHRDQDREQAKALAESVRQAADGDALLVTCANVVTAYIMMRGGLMVEALNLVLPAITWLEDKIEQHWLARAFNVHNCVVAQVGDFERCIVGLSRQLEISQRVGDAEMQVSALNDFGVMLLERDPVRAEQYLLDALKITRHPGLVLAEGYALLSLTEFSITHKRLADAQMFLVQAFEVARANALTHVETYALMYQGVLALNANALELAENLFQEALNRTKANLERPLAEIMPFMVELYRRSNRLEMAQTLLENHLKRMVEAGLVPFEIQAHELLTDILEERGDLAGALHHSRKHLQLTRQVHSTQNNDKVRVLEVLHRTQMTQRRVEDEQRKNTELAAALGQLEVLNQTVLEVSLTDELTGLRNRRYLMNLDLSPWAGQHFALAIVDLDYFKSINDQFGHDGGDVVLREFARLLQSQIRSQDIAVRFGGEEFVILFQAATLETARVVLERLLARLRQHVFTPLTLAKPLTFTAGIVTCNDGDISQALKRADELLYQGKNAGRNSLWLEVEPSVD